MNQFIVVITGPTGAGKSTTGELVAKRFDHCVNIDADHVKHMIVSGFFDDASLPAGGGFTEWGLVGDSIGLLAMNFAQEGYSVVINGHFDQPAWSNIEKHVNIGYRVLLMPELKEVIDRDNGRSEDIAMGEASVKEHYQSFSTDPYYKNFLLLDTTNQTVDEAVEEISKLLV